MSSLVVESKSVVYWLHVTYSNSFFHQYRLDNLCIHCRVSQQQYIFLKDTETDFEDTCSLLHLSCQGSLFFHHIEPGCLHTGHSDIGIYTAHMYILKRQRRRKNDRIISSFTCLKKYIICHFVPGTK